MSRTLADPPDPDDLEEPDNGPAEDDGVMPGFEAVSPWRMRLTNGKLGPWYGPESPAAFDRALENYAQSKAGGGLWDSEDDPEHRAKPAAIRCADYEHVSRYVARRSGDLPMRELEVFCLYWEQGYSQGAIARYLGIAKATVEVYIKRLRKRVRGTDD